MSLSLLPLMLLKLNKKSNKVYFLMLHCKQSEITVL